MRILHTADWHLGRILHGMHLTEDQAHVLDQLCLVAAEKKADAVLISGDVYDRAVPPPEAVELLDDVLARLVLDLGLTVIIIAGNHDSPRRLGFGSRLLADRGLHVVGPCEAEPRPIILRDEHGPVHFHALAYAEPAEVRSALAVESIKDHDTAMAARLAGLDLAPRPARNVLLAHVFAAGGAESESERPLSVGGSGAVSPARFSGFDYVALGHLHRPQTAGSEAVRYAGSLLKYSFSEAGHNKGVSIVDLDETGLADVRHIQLAPRRDLRIIRGEMARLLADAPADPGREDYLEIHLEDKQPIVDAMGRLRQAYPNALHLRRVALDAQTSEFKPDARPMDEAEIFRAFFEQATGEAANGEQLKVFREVLQSVRDARREAEA